MDKIKCDTCGGTGITPYSMMGAKCIVCGGSGDGDNPIHPPRNSEVFEGTDFPFIGYEKERFKAFYEGHICPDREPHDRIVNHVTISNGIAGLGRNTYVTCDRCGCMSEITDYGEW